MSARGDAKTAMIAAPVFTEISYYIHYVPEADWKKAITFFSEKLGLVLKVETGGCWAEFITGGGITFALHAGKDLKPKHTGICFAVENCNDAWESLKARGVKVTSEPKKVSEEESCGRSFDFEDPFGNTFSAYGK